MWNPYKLNLALLTGVQDAGSLGGTTGPDLTRYFVVCAVLILSTAGVAWALRRLVAGNLRSRSAQRSLQIVDVLSLGGKRKLAVVRCYDRTFALGLGEREVTPIAELDAAIGEAASRPLGARSDREAFAQALEQVRASLPESPLKTRALPAQAQNEGPPRKMIRRRKPKPTGQEASGSEVPQALLSPAPRQGVRPEPQSAEAESPVAARKREAQAVASAARRIAESKRRKSGDKGTSSGLRQAAAASRLRAEAKGAGSGRANSALPVATADAPQALRLEGILG